MASNIKILIVDDEASIRFALKETLSRDGYRVVTAENGETALKMIAGQSFDLALIDLRLPDIDGMSLLKSLHEQSPETIVIVLTAYASVETAVEALRQGAHDYLFKPCQTIELQESIRRGLLKRQQELRQQGLLRQLEQQLSYGLENLRATMTEQPFDNPSPTGGAILTAEPAEEEKSLQWGDLTVDFVRHAITLADEMLELSPTEFNLLAYLVSEAPRVIPPQELVREVQGYESEQWEASETVRYHIYRIRQKIKAATKRSDVIRTVRGVGYTIGEE